MATKTKLVYESADGRVRLFHGDRHNAMEALPEESVDCIWTDPPYFLSNDGPTCVAGRRTRVNKGEWDRSRGLQVDHAFNVDWLRDCRRLLTPAGTIWVSGTLHVYLSVGMALQELDFRLLNDIVWEKPNPPPNLGCRCFTHATEMILWATKAPRGSRHRHTFNYDAMREENAGKQMKNVWQIPAAGRAEKRFGKHPTQKPLALVERCLKASTKAGDHVFDPFAGSGTTGVAALRLGLRFTGCELQREYADIAVQRLREAETARRRPARRAAAG